MAGLLEGRVAIVTGAGRGIGREEALYLAKQGAKVVVNDLGAHHDGSGGADAGPAQQVVDEIKAAGGEAVANNESVADFQGAKRILECAIDTFGKCDTLVNNAGILRDKMIFKMTEEDWDAVIAVHLKGSFNTIRHIVEYWRNEGKAGNILNGRIVNTSSDAGLIGNVGQANYAAVKAALIMLAVVADYENVKYGVCANAIAPIARTRMTVDATPSTAAIMGAEVKQGEFDTFGPQNIAPLIAFLCSDDAKDIHGQVFRVGGRAVWLVAPWKTAATLKTDGMWDPKELGAKINEEVAKGITAREDMMQVFAAL